MDLLPEADVRTISDIMVCYLPPEQKKEFTEWSKNVKQEDYWTGITAFFDNQEVIEAVAEYATGQIEYMERFLGIRIDALLTISGRRYAHRNLYEELS